MQQLKQLPATAPISALTFGPCEEGDLPMILGTGLAWVSEGDGTHHLIVIATDGPCQPASLPERDDTAMGTMVDFIVQPGGRLAVSLTRSLDI